MRRAPSLLAAASAQGRTSGLMLLDLDGFKLLNDSVGHHAGDQVLVETVRRLHAVVGPGDLVARLGGDEFAVLVPALEHSAQAEQLAQDLVDALVPPIAVDDLVIAQRASIGLAVHDHDGDTLDALLRAADQAMYVAKATSPGQWRASTSGDDRRPGHAAWLLAALRSDASQSRVVVHYQPQVALDTGRITGYEALVRWDHADLGLLSPERFMPVAERSGLMSPISDAVADRCFADLAVLDEATPGVSVSLNTSQRHLMRRGFAEDLLARLATHGVEPSRVVLEVAENVAQVSPGTSPVFHRLKEAGLGVSVRAFGSAQTSLAALWANPAVVEVKIDRALTTRLPTDDSAARLVRAIAGAAHELGLRVVAVGVETPAANARVAELGCDASQGFAIAAPACLGDTVALARSWPERWPLR